MNSRTTTIGGVSTTTIEQGDWTFQRSGWNAWTAAHKPTSTTVETGRTDLDDARALVVALHPDLSADLVPSTHVGYSFQTGRASGASVRGRRTPERP